MSVPNIAQPPGGSSAERAAAKETIWRLAAVALGHPAPELQTAFENGSFHAAFDAAWSAVTGWSWPRVATSADFLELEAGYISAFLHGPTGKPAASLLAGDHERLLCGLTRPVYMLNVSAFYRHFGLKAATQDEGRTDEPDHLASMFEFMAVLTHLESQAIRRGKDPSAFRRAQRDFLRRYLCPLMNAIAEAVHGRLIGGLDQTLAQLIEELPGWAESQAAELEARVGPYRDTDKTNARPGDGLDHPTAEAKRVVDQNLWG